MPCNLKLSEKIFLKSIIMNYPDCADSLNVMLSKSKVVERECDTYGAYVHFSEMIDAPGLRTAECLEGNYFTYDCCIEELNTMIMFILYLNDKNDGFSFLEITFLDPVERDFFHKKYPDVEIKDKKFFLKFLDFLDFDEIEDWVALLLLDSAKFELI